MFATGVAVVCLSGVAVTPAQAQQGQVHAAPGAEVVPGQYIVMLKPDQGSAAKAVVNKHGGKIGRVFRYALNGFTLTATEEQAKRLAADPRVDRVEADAVVHNESTQTTPPWNLDRIDQRTTVLDDNYTYQDGAGVGVTAYVMDTGVRTAHAEFEGRASVGYDAIRDGWNGEDCSTSGHGTHVAGTIGGATYGVAKKVKLVSVRVLSCENNGSISQIIDGVDWLTANATKPAVVNMSLGGGRSVAEETAVKNSINSGLTYVVAAGNDNRDACNASPAALPEAITVGASNPIDERAREWTDPPSTVVNGSNWGRCLDLFAPGESIKSAHNATNTATVVLRGTSMAAPHVAGAVALLLSQSPNLTPAQVTSTILGRATVGVLQAKDLGTDSPNRLLYTGVPAPAVCTFTDDTRQPIPDQGTLTRTADVTTCARKVADTARVRVRAEHPFRGDLSVALIAPNGVERVLRQANGDDAATNLDETYPLTGMSSVDANGKWKLVVKDNYGFDEGALLGWTLTLAEPAVAQPVVTSTAYPADGQAHGGVGVAGSFTFKAGSSVPVAKYSYRLDGEAQPREAIATNSEATVSITPATGGPRTLTVRAVNGVGEPSDAVEHLFIVATSPPPAAPVVSSWDYPADGRPNGGVGLPGVFTFKPGGAETVTQYSYQLDGDAQPTVVPAGGEVSVGVTPGAAGQRTLTVRAVNGGVQSAATTHAFTVSAAGDIVDGTAVSIDGAVVTASIPADKAVRVKFAGTAGDKVGIGVPTNAVSTFVKLWVLDPSGRSLSFDRNGGPGYTPVRGGRSIALPTLPSTGQYSIILDPDGTGTGDAGVQVSRCSSATTDTAAAGSPYNTTRPGQFLDLSFDGDQDTWYDFGVTDKSSSLFLSVDAIDPAGVRIGATQVPLPAGRFRTSAAGKYRVVVGNYFGEATGAAKVWLSKEVSAGDITTSGAGKVMTLTRPGQHARLRFDGTTGQRLGVGYTDVTPANTVTTSVVGPDGSVATPTSSSLEASIPALKATGSHELLVHLGTAIGSLTASLAADVLAGPIAVGGATKQVSVSRAGQHARVTFDGVAGQRVNLGLNGAADQFVRLVKPDGAAVNYGDVLGTADSVSYGPLPSTGTYEVEVSSATNTSATTTLTLSAPADAGTITPGGAAALVSVTRSGQDGQVSFAGVSGDRLRLTFSGSTFALKTFLLTVSKPDGSKLVDRVYRTDQSPYDLPQLPAGGTYVVTVDPSSAGTGSISVGLARVP
ncbi:subtilisin family serine protease [Actinokineospora baliensis]|uniref:S8 family peptidase n=1 Tax=Actinokineospora baliensis TaxID=547056 RepID=UPI00195D3517|nr:S8 family peptidase [Actinokineospora baliensis]MBM7774680.1 subtilisin family serine protease [Actinokineospora baliensis]